MSSADTAISFGCWTACIRSSPSDSCLFFLLSVSRVSGPKSIVRDTKLIQLAVNGKHIAADTLFIEKRRRGLARFANALVRHPALSQDQLVIMFLTVPTVDVRPLPSVLLVHN